MQPQSCYFCGHTVSMVHVHGHYQCPVCFTNALPCCDSDNYETNELLKKQQEFDENNETQIISIPKP